MKLIELIHKEAEKRYRILPTHCRQEKKLLNHLRDRYIEKKMREFGLIKDDNQVNS